MGKISEYIIELGEQYEYLLNKLGNTEAAQDEMKNILSPDEIDFFYTHLDIIEENLDFIDSASEEGRQDGYNQNDEDYVMESIETWDESKVVSEDDEIEGDWREDDPGYTKVNGKWMRKNSREYQKWYSEEGEFDDTEGREWRSKRHGW
jgi:hypothetical protein